MNLPGDLIIPVLHRSLAMLSQPPIRSVWDKASPFLWRTQFPVLVIHTNGKAPLTGFTIQICQMARMQPILLLLKVPFIIYVLLPVSMAPLRYTQPLFRLLSPTILHRPHLEHDAARVLLICRQQVMAGPSIGMLAPPEVQL